MTAWRCEDILLHCLQCAQLERVLCAIERSSACAPSLGFGGIAARLQIVSKHRGGASVCGLFGLPLGAQW